MTTSVRFEVGYLDCCDIGAPAAEVGDVAVAGDRFPIADIRPLLDHLVGGRQQRLRHSETEHPGSFGVDDQLELGRLHHRRSANLAPLRMRPT